MTQSGSGSQIVGSMLEVRRLRYFVTIVRCGSMAAAARDLNVAQPALSHHIAELERIVGFTLLERLPRGVRPTPGGLMLLDHARIILEDVARAERELRAYAAGSLRNATIRLGILPSWVNNFGDLILQLARSRFLDRHVQMLEVRNDEADRLINRGEIDLAIMLDPDPQFPEPILEEPLFVASSSPLPPAMRLADLADMELVLASASHIFRQNMERVAAENGRTLKVVLEVDGFATLKKAVEQGIGNTVISWNSIRRECAEGLLYAAPIVDPPLKRPIYLRRAPGFDPGLAAQFFRILRDAATLPAESLRRRARPHG